MLFGFSCAQSSSSQTVWSGSVRTVFTAILLLDPHHAMCVSGRTQAGPASESISGGMPPPSMPWSPHSGPPWPGTWENRWISLKCRLDLARFGGAEGEAALVAFLKGRIQSHPVDLVVSVGAAGMQFAARHREGCLPGVPRFSLSARSAVRFVRRSSMRTPPWSPRRSICPAWSRTSCR